MSRNGVNIYKSLKKQLTLFWGYGIMYPETRIMCIFETETRKMVETETESLADLWCVDPDLRTV